MTVDEYLQALPDERREALHEVRAVILANLPEGYVETYNWGMISYEVPLAVYPDTYNKKPLLYVALGSKKSYMTLHLCSLYSMPGRQETFAAEYAASGKKLDMGAACVHFKKLDNLPLDVIGKTVAAVPLDEYVAMAKAARKK
ncbi:hypothetical protein BH11ARM1_BH11ARM1_14070 [soil metagenome]